MAFLVAAVVCFWSCIGDGDAGFCEGATFVSEYCGAGDAFERRLRIFWFWKMKYASAAINMAIITTSAGMYTFVTS